MSSMLVTEAVPTKNVGLGAFNPVPASGAKGTLLGDAGRSTLVGPGKHARRTHGNSRTLRFDDHRGPDLDPVVHLDDILVPHAHASVAHGLSQNFGLRGSVEADRPSVSFREGDPSKTEGIVEPRGDASAIRAVGVAEIKHKKV